MGRVVSKILERKGLAMKQLKADLEEIFLRRVLRGPVHGYSFITEVRDEYGAYFGPSTIYPLVNSLEKDGYVTSKWVTDGERPRKEYHYVPFRTMERLRLIRDDKNQNRKKMEKKSAESLSVQLAKPLSLEI